MGWLITLALTALSFGFLYYSKQCSRQALEICAAALLIGIAGYAWQGSPELEGNPVSRATLR